MIKLTTASKKIKAALDEPTFYKVIQGGQSAGKTYTIMTLLIGYCCHHADKVVTVVGRSYPFLERGAMRDFQNITKKDFGIWRSEQWNVAKSRYTFRNGTVLEFMPADKIGDAKGLRRDILYVNEANEAVSYEVFDLLAPRSRKMAIVDYNPTSKFWAHEELVEGVHKNRTTFLLVTYKDNEAIDDQERMNIESHKPKPGEEPSNWWVVYGLGQIGSLEGNVYKGWLAEQTRPEGFVLKRYGVDFGFSNDPTAVIAVYENEAHEIFAETMIYEKGLLTPELIEKMKKLEPALAVCDNARPEIIAEMRRSGLRAIGCDKTPGEKMNGKRYNIELVQRRTVYYLKSDKDLEKEYLSYAWRKKRSTGEWLDEPEDGNDHDVDALSYAIRDMVKKRIEF